MKKPVEIKQELIQAYSSLIKREQIVTHAAALMHSLPGLNTLNLGDFQSLPNLNLMNQPNLLGCSNRSSTSSVNTALSNINLSASISNTNIQSAAPASGHVPIPPYFINPILPYTFPFATSNVPLINLPTQPTAIETVSIDPTTTIKDVSKDDVIIILPEKQPTRDKILKMDMEAAIKIGIRLKEHIHRSNCDYNTNIQKRCLRAIGTKISEIANNMNVNADSLIFYNSLKHFANRFSFGQTEMVEIMTSDMKSVFAKFKGCLPDELPIEAQVDISISMSRSCQLFFNDLSPIILYYFLKSRKISIPFQS